MDPIQEEMKQQQEEEPIIQQQNILENILNSQTKKLKRDSSVLLLDYPQQNSETTMFTREPSMDEIDHSHEGVNLQAIIIACQAQRQDTIPLY